MQKAKDIVFIQRSRLGRVTFHLKGTSLTAFAKNGESELDLAGMAPEYERTRWRAFTAIYICSVIALCIAVMIRWLSFLPEGLYIMVAEYGALFAIPFAIAAIRFIKPIESVRFKDFTGKFVLTLTKEKSQADEFEEFVAAVQRAIVVARDRKYISGPSSR